MLLAEDNALVGIELCERFENAGFLVGGPFTTAGEALAFCESLTPDLAVLDVILADGVGDELVRALRGQGVPILVYSGWARGDALANAFQDLPWLEKPAPPHLVVNRVRELVLGSFPSRVTASAGAQPSAA